MIRAEPVEPQQILVPEVMAVEQRQAERFSLLIRTAKLVSSDGEFLCVIRDVSATGLSIKTFHELRFRKRMKIETQSGKVLPVELVWTKGCSAGFSFMTDVDVDALIDDRTALPKRALRFSCRIAGSGSAGSAPAFPLSIRNISQQGARIECETRLAVDQPVQITCPALQMIESKVRWRDNSGYGIVFERTFRLEEFALLLERIRPWCSARAVSRN